MVRHSISRGVVLSMSPKLLSSKVGQRDCSEGDSYPLFIDYGAILGLVLEGRSGCSENEIEDVVSCS